MLVYALDMQRRAAEEQLTKLAVRLDQVTGNQEGNKAAAKRVIDSVSKLIQLPKGVDPTVAKIVNVEALQARNAFYKKAKNGDYLLVTTDRAIIYDPVKNILIDVAPVQIQPVTPQGQAASVQGSAGTVAPTK